MINSWFFRKWFERHQESDYQECPNKFTYLYDIVCPHSQWRKPRSFHRNTSLLNSNDFLAWYIIFVLSSEIWAFSSAKFKNFFNRSFVRFWWRSLILNKINSWLGLCPILFSKQLIISLVSFNWFTFLHFCFTFYIFTIGWHWLKLCRLAHFVF